MCLFNSLKSTGSRYGDTSRRNRRPCRYVYGEVISRLYDGDDGPVAGRSITGLGLEWIDSSLARRYDVM